MHPSVPGSILSPRMPEEESKEERLERQRYHQPRYENSPHPSASFTTALLHSLNHMDPSDKHSDHVALNEVSTAPLGFVIPELPPTMDNDDSSSSLFYTSPTGQDTSTTNNPYNNHSLLDRENTSSTNASRLYTSASIRSITLIPVGSSYSLSRPSSSMDMQDLHNTGSSSNYRTNYNNYNHHQPYRSNRTPSIGTGSNGGGGGGNALASSTPAYLMVSEPSSPAFSSQNSPVRLHPDLNNNYNNNGSINAPYSRNESKEYETTVSSDNPSTSSDGWNGSFHRRKFSNSSSHPSHPHRSYPSSSITEPLSTILTVDALDNNVFTITDAENTLPDNNDSQSENSAEWDAHMKDGIDMNRIHRRSNNPNRTKDGTFTVTDTALSSSSATTLKNNFHLSSPGSVTPSTSAKGNYSSSLVTRSLVSPSPLPFPVSHLPEHFKPSLYRTPLDSLSSSFSSSTATLVNNPTSLSPIGVATANHVINVDEALRFLLHPLPKSEPMIVIRATITTLPIPGSNGNPTYTFWYNPPPPLSPTDPIASPIMLMVATRTMSSVHGPPCYLISLADSVLSPSSTGSTADTRPSSASSSVASSLVTVARLRGTKNGDSYVLYDGGKRSKNILQTIDMYKESGTLNSTINGNGALGTSTHPKSSVASTKLPIANPHAKPVTHTRRHHRRGSLIGLSTSNIAVGINKLVQFAWSKPSSASNSDNHGNGGSTTNTALSHAHHPSSSTLSTGNERVPDHDTEDNEDIGLSPILASLLAVHHPTNQSNTTPSTVPSSSAVAINNGSMNNSFIATHVQLGHVSFETDINYGMSESALEKLGISRSREDDDIHYGNGSHGTSGSGRKKGPMVVAIPGVKLISSIPKGRESTTEGTGSSNGTESNNHSNSSSSSSGTGGSVNKGMYALWPWPRWETGLPSHSTNLLSSSNRTLLQNTWYAGLPDVLHQWRYDSFTIGYRHSGQVYILAGNQVPVLSPLYDNKYAFVSEANSIGNSTMNNISSFPTNRINTAHHHQLSGNRFIRSASAKSLSSVANDASSVAASGAANGNDNGTAITKHFTSGMNFCLRDATFIGPSVFMQNDSSLSSGSGGIPNFSLNRSVPLPIGSSPENGRSGQSSVVPMNHNLMDKYRDAYLFVRQIGRDMSSLRLDITVRYPLSLVQAFGIILARIDTLTNGIDKK